MHGSAPWHDTGYTGLNCNVPAMANFSTDRDWRRIPPYSPYFSSLNVPPPDPSSQLQGVSSLKTT